MNKNLLKFLIAGMVPVLMLACKKNNTAVDVDPIIPEELARVAMTAPAVVFDIRANTTVYKVPIGITTVSNVDRTVHVQASSSTGAVAGTHYTVPTSIVIPAGKTLDSLPITFTWSQYETGRRDSVTITVVEGGGVKPAPFSNRFTVYGKGFCEESNVTQALMSGDYTNTNEDWGGSPYGPYTTTISNWVSTSATTATIQVENIFDYGWAPITFTLDWTDPNNRKVTLVEQSGIANGSTISSTYAGMDVSVRPYGTTTGTFSACGQTVTLRMDIGITGVGWFNELYEVVLER